MTRRQSLYSVGLCFLLAISLAGCTKSGGDEKSNPVGPTPPDPAASEITVMIFLDADNNLDLYAGLDMQEMVDGMKNAGAQAASAINLIVLYDSPGSSGTVIYRITSSGRTTLENLAEQNMGDPQTLIDFIQYCRDSYPADRYALVIWNHGDGARIAAPQADSKAISFDATSDDALLLNELQQALGYHFNPAEQLGLIGFDACLMGTIEVAYEMRDLARTMVGSMHKEQPFGWDYERIFEDSAKILAGSRSFAEHIVDTYREWVNANYSGNGQTMSAIDLTQIEALKTEVDNLATIMQNNLAASGDNWYAAEQARAMTERYYIDNDINFLKSSTYIDLGDFCRVLMDNSPGTFTVNAATAAQSVRTVLGNAVIKAFGDSGSDMTLETTAYFGAGGTVRRGLSIFFQQPPYSGSYNYDFANWTANYTAYNGWYTGQVFNEGSWGTGGQLDFCRDSTWKSFMDYVFGSNH